MFIGNLASGHWKGGTASQQTRALSSAVPSAGKPQLPMRAEGSVKHKREAGGWRNPTAGVKLNGPEEEVNRLLTY